MAELIGTGRCPIGCGSTKARYTLSAKGLPVGTCNSCNCQVFARSDRSDETLRAKIIPAAAPVDEPPADPVRETAPTEPPAPAPSPAPTPKPRTYSWGILAGQEQ